MSAGTGAENGRTWPRLLAERRHVEVADLAVAAATVTSQLHHIHGFEFADGIVVLEIGGNDMFMRRPPDAFEADLDQLAARVAGAGRQVIMFELPLMPFDTAYGAAQRRVAAKWGIHLIPRRWFAALLAKQGATTADGIHLSMHGQDLMEQLVWRAVGDALTGTSTPAVTSP
jgi:lysophospholipase L1-like esterase